jgi:hypothetical protein
MISLKRILLIDIVNLIFRPAIAVMPAGEVRRFTPSPCPGLTLAAFPGRQKGSPGQAGRK